MYQSRITHRALRIVMMLTCMAASLTASAAIPSAQLRTIEGETVETSTLSTEKGQPVILTFFATWCKPCMRELAALSERHDELEEQGVRVVAVSIDEAADEHKVVTLANSKAWPFEVLLDPAGDLHRAMGVQVVPHAFVIAPDGDTVLNHPGYQDGSEAELIKAALKAKK